MATRFTPGPWHYDDHMVCGGPKMEYVCEVSGAASNEFHKANAALISAAPEMYEELEAAYSQAVAQFKAGDRHATFNRQMVEAWGKALAKARGEA